MTTGINCYQDNHVLDKNKDNSTETISELSIHLEASLIIQQGKNMTNLRHNMKERL